MKKNNKEKILSIIALVVALSGLTIGFAAFSSTLTISSSAIVTPNSEDFDIKVYGFKDLASLKSFYEDRIVLDEYLDSTKSVGFNWGNIDTASGTESIIDNDLLEIKNIEVNFIDPDSEFAYLYVIRNEGEYDAYMPVPTEANEDGKYPVSMFFDGICTAEEGTTQELVDAACDYIIAGGGIIDPTTLEAALIDEPYYKLSPGKEAILILILTYHDTQAMADGPFNVEFPTIPLPFTTTKPTIE